MGYSFLQKTFNTRNQALLPYRKIAERADPIYLE